PHSRLLFSSLCPRPPRSTLFPYTTLFRSAPQKSARRGEAAVFLSGLAQQDRHPRGDARCGSRYRLSRRSRRGEPPPELVYRDQADRKSTRLNSSHVKISYAVFCLKKKKKK